MLLCEKENQILFLRPKEEEKQHRISIYITVGTIVNARHHRRKRGLHEKRNMSKKNVKMSVKSETSL